MPSRNLLAVLLMLAAGCTDASPRITAPVAPSADRGNADADAGERLTASALWNQRTRAVIGRRGGSSPNAARTFALVSVAQYDAVIAAGAARTHGHHGERGGDRHPRPSESGAAAAASAAVLAGLYSAEQSFVDSALAADAARFAACESERGADWDAGVEVGRAVAAAVLARAATDGSRAAWTGAVPVGPGYWIPVSMPPQDANWGGVRPWLLASASQFRPAPPPAFGSPAFLADLAEVRQFSDTRTPEQLAIARYWATGYGAGGPAGFFGSVAAELAAREHLGERRTAQRLAVMHMAIMDASIGCYEAKYLYWYIRPYQADAAITVPVTRPNFPSYPSAHSCLSAAAAGVLAGYFPSARDSLEAMVQEAGLSRIYAGLHFRFEVTAGQELGRSVARLALRRAPRGRQPIALE